MSETLLIHKWGEWQSYRQDRGAPPWIKVHRKLLTNTKWAALTDSEKGQLVSLWLIAADNDGIIPNDPKIIRKVCMLDDEPNISKFINLGLIDNFCPNVDASMTPSCQPFDPPEERREEKRREEKNIKGKLEKQVFDPTTLCPDWVNKEDWDDLITHRKNHSKKPVQSKRAFQVIIAQLKIAIGKGFTAKECIDKTITRNWQSFDAEWMENLHGRNGTKPVIHDQTYGTGKRFET
jgi:hypothetical protein